GSGGMFVQSAHFIERLHQNPQERATFYGMEKNALTIRLGKMNLAVHGLEGNIQKAITYYEDPHELLGKADFVMANPPFNVDEVDADKVKNDPRLPFGLPGVNKKGAVSNGNYLWISYFYSYLNARGRAGFVMSSQASSAGRDEAMVRRKLIETGQADVMIAIRSNFFYTRTVPCELWFFDKGKPAHLRNKVLMIDARNIYRKVTRKIYDFSPEQLQNLSAIVWLYRGKTDKFLALVKDYLDAVGAECEKIPDKLHQFETLLDSLRGQLEVFSTNDTLDGQRNTEKQQTFNAALAELRAAEELYKGDRAGFVQKLDSLRKNIGERLPVQNAQQHAARKACDPIVEKTKGLIKQVDLLYKLVSRAVDMANGLASSFAPSPRGRELEGGGANSHDRRSVARLMKDLDAARKDAVEQLKQAAYLHRQVAWLQDRFPEAKLADVSGLVKLVDLKEIAAADWSLTPGRYVGVAPLEEDEDFDFEETLRDIHVELASLNQEAVELARKIQENFAELGV
ncbi:MAG: HsdM family class I SAM-dependent methyltransferase, partial [Candidatus Binatia bacterium]